MEYSTSILSLFIALGAYALYKIAQYIYDYRSAPVRAIRGPSSPSLFFGNMKVIEQSGSVLQEKWVAEYGHTITYNVLLSRVELYTMDTKAIGHILMNNYIYQRAKATNYIIGTIVGNGVLATETDVHKKQRRIMNPAFGPAQIRELTEIFIEKSIELRDVLAKEVSKTSSNGRLDILSWLSKMTLDVIGQAGFNYQFGALAEKTSPLNDAFSAIFSSATDISLILLLRAIFPVLRFLPERKDKTIKEAHQVMNEIGSQLLHDSKADTLNDNKTSWRRDLLSLLIRANTSPELPPSQRMSDSDVLAQVPTFLIAGHETTSTATTWALYALTQNTAAQAKLREELANFNTDRPTMDELNSLPYLDAVVREALRAYPPVDWVPREAAEDDYLPFGEPLMDKNGRIINGIHVKKGQSMMIPIEALNRAKSIWGEDSFEFKPERWEKIPEAASSIPGVWGNMLTFLGGPRACIGYRFSLVEMKALLFILIRAFEFELAVPASDISKKTFLVQRPFLKSDPKAGNQMPLILRLIQSEL